MAQGVEWDKEKVIEQLRPFFQLGCNVRKACSYAGIPQPTVATWIMNDPLLQLKINVWQHEMSIKSRKVWNKAIEDGSITQAVDWLRVKEKEEFGNKTEIDLKGEITSHHFTPERLAELEALLVLKQSANSEMNKNDTKTAL